LPNEVSNRLLIRSEAADRSLLRRLGPRTEVSASVGAVPADLEKATGTEMWL
jgi:hypothetical protein